MPKKKKQPRNAYYFFISDKKKEYERDGTRFHSIQDVFAMENLREEWKELDPLVRAKYDGMAKDAKAADKVDLTNKFTCSGESYAQVNERQMAERREHDLREELLAVATQEGAGLSSRKFVVFKSIYVAEVGYPPDQEYWPSELAIASFSLDDGHISHWWTLVDTVTVPLGYATQAKDNFTETRLPVPGSHKFKPAHKDYAKVLFNLKRFISCYVEPIKGFYVLFNKPDDEKLVDEGILKWLLRNARYESREMENEFYDFFERVKFLRLTKMLLKFAAVARLRTPTYSQPIAVYNHLESAASYVLCSGDFDYNTNITCAYHNLSTEDEESMRMNYCCKNVVLRYVFILLRELLPPMQIQPKSTHVIGCIKTPPDYQIPPRPPPQKREIDEVEESPEMLACWDAGYDSKPKRVSKSERRGIAGVDYEEDPSVMGAAAQGEFRPPWSNEAAPSAAVDSAWGAPAPSFSGEDFPALGAVGVGRGRGTPRGRDFVAGYVPRDSWAMSDTMRGPPMERNLDEKKDDWFNVKPGGRDTGPSIGRGRVSRNFRPE